MCVDAQERSIYPHTHSYNIRRGRSSDLQDSKAGDGGVLRMCGLSNCLSCVTAVFSFLKAVGSQLKATRA